MAKYRFNKKEHLHEILIGEKWQPVTGCTTILNVLAKPMLIQWAANLGAATGLTKKVSDIAIEEFTEALNGKLDSNLARELGKKYPEFEEARTAHCKRKEKAGDYGTKLHESISNLIGLAIKKNKGFIPEPIIDLSKLDCGIDKSLKNFIDWADKSKVKFLESEKNVYSEKLWLGGIIDFVCEIDGKVWLGDIKTSKSGIYPENFAQIAGYQLMIQEMGLYPDIAGYVVLNLKQNGEFLEKRNISNEENREFFLACLKIYRVQEKIKNNTLTTK